MIQRILCIGLLASALILAQGKKGGGSGNNSMGGFASASRIDILNEQLKLTKDQKKEVKEIGRAHV